MKKIKPFAYLIGKVIGIRKGTYESKRGIRYTLFLLVKGQSKRLSSILPVMLFEKQIIKYKIEPGIYLQVTGSLNVSENPNLFVTADTIEVLSEQEYENVSKNKEENNKVVYIGCVSKFPMTFTAKNKNRSYIRATISSENKKDSLNGVPILCEQNERNLSVLTLGNRVCVVGRLESKKIKDKNTDTDKTIYELFVFHTGRYNPDE